jgi:chemotaxis protein histidine kinase CheA
MIVMTDITTQRKLEQQLRIDEEKNRMIVKIAVDRHGFIDFLNDVNRYLDQVEQILVNHPSAIRVDELFRLFHTVKGGMASYFFITVAAKAHDIENLLESVRTDSGLPTEDLLQSVRKETVRLRELLKATLNDLDQIIPKQLIDAGFQPYFRISESKITELESVLKAAIDSSREVKRVVGNLRKQPIRNIMKKYAADAETMATNLGKKLKINLTGDDTELIHKSFKPMLASLIHIIRNCVDHGIELPDERLAADKPETGHLEIKVEVDDSQLRIAIADDGAGINTNRIKAKALEKGLIGSVQAESMSDSAAIKLIFQPGFSTKDTVTDLSGRGVGMDAVAESVAALKGTIDIRTSPGVGSRFLITVPTD